jgi:FtsP/CotA-like multicopper oxidase with cupredoxin domain
MSRLRFLALGAVLTLLVPGVAVAEQSPQVPLAGTAIPQFVQPLPAIDVVGGNQPLTIRMCEFDANVLPPIGGIQHTTRVWGYVAGECPAEGAVRDTYLGPIIVANRGTPTQVTWVNELGRADETGVLAYRYSTDQTLHWADPLNDGANECAEMAGDEGGGPEPGSECAENYDGPIPAVAHLHGGEVPSQIDGGPNAWFTSDGTAQGPGYYSFPAAAGNAATYVYPNIQEAAPLWFHDHVLGVTRLDVYAGLAGGYLLVDPEQALPPNLPGPADIVPLVIQDRQFDTDGQLFFQADTAGGIQWAPNPEHPYWSPEFVGDTIVVNGKAWPYKDVEAKRYRFLLLNGSNARSYDLWLTDPVSKNPGPPLWIIGTDGGYLDAPVKVDPAAKTGPTSLVMMPGERYEAIIDFAAYGAGVIGPNGQPYSGQWMLRNGAKTPFPSGAPPKGNTTARIMQFVVGPASGPDTSYDPASDGALRLDQPIVRLADPSTGTLTVTPDATRALTLNEVDGVGGPLEALVNNTEWTGESERDYGDFTPVSVGGETAYYSELPVEGSTEVWEFVNLTADAHPIHLHLAQFQVLNRQKFNVARYTRVYNRAFPSGAYEPGFGPPLAYQPSGASGGKYGGNPDVAAYLQGPIRPPASYEAGWKDTVTVLPGQLTRIVVRWAPTDIPISAPAGQRAYEFDPNGGPGYVWHCHILDHEDNEMMRPTQIQLNPAAPLPSERTFRLGIDY